MNIRKVLFAATLLLPVLAEAKITLPPFFSDNMVLQQKSELEFWGKASPGKKVRVTTSWDGKVIEMKADTHGMWSTVLSTPEAGGPYTISITDGKKLVLENILIGEVWLCGGQSNMEMKIDDKVTGWQEEKAAASKLKNVRILHVENSISPVLEDNIVIRHGGWQECSPETIGDFSAAGYFFGKNLNENLDIPIGLIESCWGGTLAEAWTSEKALRDIPYFHSKLNDLKNIPSSLEERETRFMEQMDKWELEMKNYDKGFTQTGASWADNSFDDSGWAECQVPGFMQDYGIHDLLDYFWMRKTVDIPETWAGRNLVLGVGAVDDNDFTYFNGERVGRTEGCIAQRRYTVPGHLVKAGRNTVAIRVMNTGGLSGILGDDNSIMLKKSDNETIALTGIWKYNSSIDLEEAPVFPVNTAHEANYPTFLYNAMIHPLRRYGVKGAIWYQGEANTSRAEQYKDLLPLMIKDWRETFGCELPFYIVQLANYMTVQTGAEESEWAALREAQTETAAHLENTGLAVTIDIGEANDIHPKNKSEVGRRLAMNALAGTYGRDIEHSGPLYDRYTIEGSTIRIHFSHTTGGLKAYSYGKKTEEAVLEGFYIAGGDHVFHKADARIEGDTVVVSSDKVGHPVSVRYAWANNPVCNLYNGCLLPASPFRTDAWSR